MSEVKAPRFPTERTTKPEAALRKAKSLKPLPKPPMGSGVVEALTGVPPAGSMTAPDTGPVDVLLAGLGLFPGFSRRMLRAMAGVNAARSSFKPGTIIRGVSDPSRLQPWTEAQRRMLMEFADAYPVTGAHISRYMPFASRHWLDEGFIGQARMHKLMQSLRRGIRPPTLEAARPYLGSVHIHPGLSNNEFASTLHHEGDHIAQGILNPWMDQQQPVDIAEAFARRSEAPRKLRGGYGGVNEDLHLSRVENGVNDLDPTLDYRLGDLARILTGMRDRPLTMGQPRPPGFNKRR